MKKKAKKILILSPHADDETIGVGGLIALAVSLITVIGTPIFTNIFFR